jgi:hypothetical protein
VNNETEYHLLVEALEIRKTALPENHVDIADSLKFMGRFFHENHDDQKTALPFYQKALAIYERNDSTGVSVDTVSAMNDVACALEDLDRVDEARFYYERAYRCSHEGQGPRHSETATMASNLALLITEHFPHEVYEAVPLLRLSLKISEVVNGLENPETQDGRKHLGQTLLECVKFSKQQSKDSDFRAGDRVKLHEDKELNKKLAVGHGEWADDMDKYSGQEGSVRSVDVDGDVLVKFDLGGRGAGLHHKARSHFTFNPAALTLISKAADRKESTMLMTLAAVARTCTQVGRDWSGSDEEAEKLVTAEAEELLLRALAVLEKDADQVKSARVCADLLVDLYEEAGETRKKDMKSMQKRMDALEAWCSDSSDESDSDSDSDSDDSDSDSDSDSGSDNGKGFVEVQDILLERNSSFARALQPTRDANHISMQQLQDVMKQLEQINITKPPCTAAEKKDRLDTKKALEKKIAVVKQRDRAAALLGSDWNALVSE